MIALREFASGAEMMKFYRELKARTRALGPPPPPVTPPPPPAPEPPPPPQELSMPTTIEPEPEPTPVPEPFVFVPRTPIRRIIFAVAKEFGVPPHVILSTARTREAVVARQVVALLGRELTNLSTIKIGRVLGGRNHTTILYSCVAIKTRIASNPALAGKLERLRATLLDDTKSNAEPANHGRPKRLLTPTGRPETVGADRESMETRPMMDIGTGGRVSAIETESGHDRSQQGQRDRDQRPGAPDAKSFGPIVGCGGDGHGNL